LSVTAQVPGAINFGLSSGWESGRPLGQEKYK